MVLGLLNQVSSDSRDFADILVAKIQVFSRTFSKTSTDDQRWSLVDCGLKEQDWLKIAEWARQCPPVDLPRSTSRAAGILLLLIAASVSRSLERDEPLWQMVADACSEHLRVVFFGRNTYPMVEVREAFSEACEALGLRHQLDMPGKHRFWRTVQLQIGFGAKTGASRLPFWLAGYGVPETVQSLLEVEDVNASQSFRQLWHQLKTWSRSPNDENIENELRNNPWYPAEAHELLKAGLAAGREYSNLITFRVDDEAAVSSLFGVPRFRNGLFQFGLSNFQPKEIANVSAPVLRLYMEGIGWSRLVRNEEGGRTLEEGSLRVDAWDALQNPIREVSVVGASGALYKERFQLWPEDAEFVLYRGDAGRQIRDINRFVAEVGCPYVLVTQSDVQVFSAMGRINCIDQSDKWSLYRFTEGLPAGFELRMDGAQFWARGGIEANPTALSGASFQIRELSPISLDLFVHVPIDWTVERFRFAGRSIPGDQVVLEVSPVIEFANKTARIVAFRGEERRTFDLKAERVGEKSSGAAFQNKDGEWHILQADAPLDVGQIEGRLLAVHWDENSVADPWLTLGRQPLLNLPHVSRRQRYIATGEPLQLRFGLMNEETGRRIRFASASYSTGALGEVRDAEDDFVLVLRESMEAAPDLRIWVWEEGCSLPRLLPKEEVEVKPDNQSLKIPKSSAPNPIGWAVALDGNWRGARFHADPQTKDWGRLCERWSAILARDDTWGECASALRWWRFPILMDPFKIIAREQAARHKYETLNSWIVEPVLSDMALTRIDAEFYANPLRTLLWGYIPTAEECKHLWADHKDAVLKAFENGMLSQATTLLLIATPVFLAKVICELLWERQQEEEATVPMVLAQSLYRMVPDPQQIMEIEARYRSLFRIARDFIERLAGYSNPLHSSDKLETLRSEALFELRSWTGCMPLDNGYFFENIVKPAEALFDQRNCDARRLKVAVTRSRTCCAFIVSHLLKTKGIRNQA